MNIDRRKLQIFLCASLAAAITYILNHQFGLGAIVSNGMVGLTAALLLPGPLAGIAYTASFVGMSSTAVLPSMFWAFTGGAILSLVVLGTTEVYAGIGGKGGTTAALSTLITKAIIGLLS
jgi:hypothetical protein